jgi:ABC-type nitrate/sulfonate/bicarbonate transport system ATPase subunit
VSILEVQRLSKSYRQMGGQTTVAVGNISCQVEAGEFVSFVGPSGCGKTTLLMSIAGLIAPTEGKVLVKGTEVNGPPPNLVLVFQEFNKSLFAWRSVLGNVLFGLDARGKKLRESEGKAKALIELVGLRSADILERPEACSSGGDRAGARLRARSAPMDEPFGSLMPDTVELKNLGPRLPTILSSPMTFDSRSLSDRSGASRRRRNYRGAAITLGRGTMTTRGEGRLAQINQIYRQISNEGPQERLR